MNASPRHVAFFFAGSLVVLVGCDGGAEGTGDAESTGGAAGVGGAAGQGSATAAVGAGGAGVTTTTGTGATTATGATTGTGTGATTGAGGSPPGATVVCGAMSCALPGDYCCENYNEPAECLAAGATCVYGVPLHCDGPEDCDQGEVCCADVLKLGQMESFTLVQCATTCSGMDHRVVCGASGVCPQGDTCTTSDVLPPYLDCQ